MPLLSSIFLVLSLVLAVTLGPQTRAWSWGPSLAALLVSMTAALPLIRRPAMIRFDRGILLLGGITAAWFAWRATTSPVPQFAQSDLLLLGATVGTFMVMRAISGHRRAECALAWGMAMLLLVSTVVVGMQVADPSYSPIFRLRADEKMVSGFYAHYNEAANYFIAASLLAAAAALFGRHRPATRILLALIAICGIACVWYTRSRGGIFGAAIGCAVLAAMSLVIAKRRGSKWFAPALVAIPLIGIAVAAYWFVGWEEAQRFRTDGKFGMDALFDNTCRLYFYGIALSCIALHPLTGGGSWSFSWECFRFWDNSVQGLGHARPELVHNELLQTATDYGIIGMVLLILLLGTLSLTAILRTLFDKDPRSDDNRWAWRAGGLAALAGMMVQSSFSFVLHHLPGVILLGICLGKLAYPAQRQQSKNQGDSPAEKISIRLTSLVCMVLMLPCLGLMLVLSWRGIRVTKELWPVYYNKHRVLDPNERIHALGKAIQIWPGSELHMERARLQHALALTAKPPESVERAKLALADYEAAEKLNPNDPAFSINSAILLSGMGEAEKAEAAYERGTRLQGGMEAAFRGHYSYASHLLRKGIVLLEKNDRKNALATLEKARVEIEQVHTQGAGYPNGKEGYNLRVNIHELLGVAHELNGNNDKAIECYKFASSMPMGGRANYRVGALTGRMARDAWHQRKPELALALFIEARDHISKAGAKLPQGATITDKAKLVKYFDESIRFLKAAKVKPGKF